MITLYDDSSNIVGGLFFYDNPEDMPDQDEERRSNYLIEHFSRILDLLRNENPIYYDYLDNYKIARVTTAIELIGEGE